jgi:adenine deaminase
MTTLHISGNLVDCVQRTIAASDITIEGGIIVDIRQRAVGAEDSSLPYITPGFVDAHVHIESSMLIPSEFARLAVAHGTVATVSDPHEIANVCGLEGVRFMIENGKTVPFKCNFGAPSCVPATIFETAGAELTSDEVGSLLEMEEVRYLSEMMNFPGAIAGDGEVIKKICAALALGKPVDGHAPGLSGERLETYVERGISTDHECFTIGEAREKLALGMKILIREGSAAKNFDALVPLVDESPEMVMFCSDDKHPDSLVLGHINDLCARAVARGCDVFNVLRAACINPVEHYKLPVGTLRKGAPADLVVLEDLMSFRVRETYINGQKVAERGRSLIPRNASPVVPLNRFEIDEIAPATLRYSADGQYSRPIIECIDGQLITTKGSGSPLLIDDVWCADAQRDILKIVVVNRYAKAPVAIAFVRNFGLTEGAIASSVAHDSHNIVAVGVDDESLARAINFIIREKGGVSCVGKGKEQVLPLPIGGLMSGDDGYAVAEAYTSIDRAAKELGSKLAAPFMSLSFMALLVIPHVKLSDKGLFDGDAFSFYQ